MDNPILRQFNAYEIIMFLHEMHQRGYEKLRLLSGMSPNGCAWRWFIYPKVLMKTDNRFEYHGDFVPFDCPFGSTGDGDAQSKSYHTIDEAIQCNEGYFNLARGRDEEYVRWFSTIVEQSKHGNYPTAFADCYLAKRWTFTGNPIEIPFPPFYPDSINSIANFTDEQLLSVAPFLFNQSSAAELNEVLTYQGPKPDNHAICEVIRQAIREKKGLISHIDFFSETKEIELFAWGDF